MRITNTATLSAKRYCRNDDASAIIYVGLIALIFANYLTTAIPGYAALMLGLLLRKGVKLPSRIVLYVCAVMIYWLAVLSYATGKNVFTHMLFYFGFLLPFMVVASDRRISIGLFVNERFVIGLCILTIFEAILFNSPIGQHLYFFPPEGSNDRVAMFGFYQRPLGIGGNASLTSVVLFFLVVLNDQIHGVIKLSTQALVLVTTLVLASGTGFGLLLVYLIVLVFRSRRLSVKFLIRGLIYLAVLLMALALALGYLVDLGDLQLNENFEKFSIHYFLLLYDYKLYRLGSFMETANVETLLFGSQIFSSSPATTGDAGVLIALDAIGGMGTALLLVAPLLYFGGIRHNIIPTIFFCLSFIHYMGILTPPGQVLLAFYLLHLAKTRYQTEKSFRVKPKGIYFVERA